MEQLGEIGQGVQMHLELALWHEEWRVLQNFDTKPTSLVSIH